jgi:uncharacterized protein HemX
MPELDDFLNWAEVHRSDLRREIRSLQAMPVVDGGRIATLSSIIEAIDKVAATFTQLDRTEQPGERGLGSPAPAGSTRWGERPQI